MSDDSDTGIPKKRTRKVRYVEDSPQNSSGDDSPIGSSSSRRKERLVIEDDSDSDSGSSIEPGVSRWKKNVRRVVESDPADSDSSGSVIVKKPRRPGRVVSSESEDDEDDTDHGFEESSSSQWESDFSQDGDDARDTAAVAANGTKQAEINASTSSKIQDTGVDSDSSDGQSDRCPICLISLRSQEIGIPESCDHMFCSECIQEWSKNVNTCPVDRQEYRLILVRSNVNGNICRRIPVEPPDPQLLQQQQQNDDMEEIIEDPTFCENCGSSDREERMLLCDGCDLGYHLECLVPPLQDIPHGSWYCSDCGAPDDTEDEVIDLVELQLLYDEAGPLVRPGLRPRASSSTRLVPRTRHSERVRRRIQNNRNSNNSTNNRRNREDEQVAAAVPGNSSRVSSTTTTTTNSTNQATAQPVRRKKTKKKRKQRRTRYKITYEIDELTGETVTVKERIKSRRRKRKRTAGGRRTGRRSENSVASARPKSVKKRLAQQLGMCAPRISVPQNVPDLRVPANTTVLGGLGLQRHQAGIPALHLFGRRHELDYFSPSSDEEIGNSDGVLVRRRAPNHSDVSIFRRAARAKSIMAPSLDLPSSSSSSSLVNNSVSSTTDLLGSILDSQAKFHSRNTIFSLDSNGKVTMEKRATGEDRLDVNSSSNVNQSVRRKPASSSQQAAGNSSGGAQQNNRDSVPSSSNRGDYHQTSSSMGYSTSSSATMPSSTVEPGSSGGFPGPSGSSGLPYGVQDYTQKTLNAAYQDNRRDRRRPLLRTPHNPPAMDEMEEREDSAYEPYDPLNPGSSRSNSPSYDNNDGGGAGDESDIDIYSDIETSAVSTSNKDESDMMTHHHHHHQQQQPHHGHMLPRPPSPPEMLMMMMSPSMMTTMTSSSSQHDLSLNNNGGGAGSNDDEHDSDDEPDMVIDTEKMTSQNENEDEACGVKEETAVSSTVDSSNIPTGEASHAENAPNVTSTLELQSEAVQSSTNRTYGAGTKPSSGNDMDDDDSEDECPNFSIYSKESITMAKNTDISLESVANNAPNEVPSVDQEMAHQEETAPLENSDQQQLEQEQQPDDQVGPQQSNPVEDNDSAQIGEISSSPSVVPTPADAPPETTFRQDCVERDSSMVHSTPTTSSDLNATNNDEAPQPDSKKKPSSTPSTTGKKKPIFGGAGVSSGLYSDSEDETIVKKDLMSPTKKKTPSTAFAISDIRNMTEDISEEEERSYTPCLDERAPGAAVAGVPPAGGLEGLDTEMISDEERNEFDESHDLKTASDAGDALEINAKESELDFTRPEDYEEGEIVDKQQKDGKTPENSNNADKDSDSGADDKTDKAAATAKSNDDKEKDDGHGSDKDKDTSGATVNTSGNSHNKEQEDEDKDKDPSSFKKLSRSNKERNYRDKEREERSRSKSPEHKTGGSGGKNATGNNTGSTSKKKREKRKEIKRYDVRALIAEKPRRLKDQFGRDIRRTSSRTRSRSLTPPPRRSASRGRRSLSRSRRSVSRDRPPVSSRIRRTLSRGRRSGSRGRRSVSRQAPRRSSMTPPPPLKRRSVSRGRNNARSRSRTPRDRSRSRDWDAAAAAPLAATSRSSRKKQRNNRSSPARARNNKSLSRSFTPPERPERSKRSRSKQRKRKRSASRSKNRRRKSRDRSKNKKKQRSRSRHRSRSFTPVTAPPPSGKRRTNKDWPQAQHLQQQQQQQQRGHSREWTPSMSRSRTPELQQQQQRLTPSWTPPRLLESAVQQPRNNLTVILPNQNAVAAASSKKKKDKKRRAEKRAKENEGNVNSAGGRQKKRRRVDRTPPPSKEVFASGDNILVSVSFNKENETRDVVSTKRKGARDIAEDLREAARKKREKRRKEQQLRNRSRADLSGIKPVAIIDLERSPFKELTPSPKDVIVLSDSETEERIMENELHRHDLASPIEERDDLQQNLCDSSQQVASPELSQSYLTSGPKTPPEPQIKFTLLSKPSQIRAISNPLHDPDDIEPEEEEDLEENNAQQNLMMSDQRGGMMDVGGVLLQHKGPNTPPEPPNSPPSSPDAYDPFEPTKSRSPTPEPQHQQQSLELQQNNNSVIINGSGSGGNNALTLEDGGPPPTENIMSAMSNLMGEILESTAAIVGHKTPPDGAAVIKSLTPPLLDVQPADSQSSIHATPETNLTKSPERTVGSAVPTTASTTASALLTTTQNTNSSSTTTTPSKPTAQTTIPFSSVAAAAASTLASTSSSTAAGAAAPSTSSIVITSTPIMASNSSNPSTTTSAQQQALAGTPTSSKINILNTTVIAAPSSLPQRIVLPSSAAVKASPVKISPNKSAAGAAAGAGGGAGIKSTTLVKPMVSTKANTATKVMRKSNTGQSNNRNQQQQQQQQNNNSTTAVDIINLLDASLNLDSPYSPGSSDYEDLFEPPTESVPPQKTVSNKSSAQQNNNTSTNNKSTSKSPAKAAAATTQQQQQQNAFDALFGSPFNKLKGSAGATKNDAKTGTATKMNKKPVAASAGGAAGGGNKGKGSKQIGVKIDEDNLRILDDLPNSAVEMQVKDKFLKKLNRQERVVEEVKLVLKPHYNKKHVTKEEYKDILRRAVPKICHNKSGEINPTKIKNLVEAYVKKVRHNKKVTSSSSVNPQKT